MAKRQKAANASHEGCATAAIRSVIGLIAVGQLAGGVGGLVAAWKATLRPADWQPLAISSLCAVLFGGIGCGLLTGLVIERRRSQAAPSNWPADEPWLARADWASGLIPAAGGASLMAPVLAAVTAWWIIASLPLISVLPAVLRGANSNWAWLTVLIPMAGLLLIAVFVYQWLAARKFGNSVLELSSVPGVIGGQLAGVLRISKRVQAPDGFRVRLTCIERQLRRAHGKYESSDVALWQDERLLSKTLDDPQASETAVPVLLAIPYEALETSRPNSRREIKWQLAVSASLLGIDYRSRFEVPVFKTVASRPDFQLEENLIADYAAPPDNERLLREAGVRKEAWGADGVRLVFTAARNWPSALIVTLFVVVFAGIFAVIGPNAIPLVPRFILATLIMLFLWVALDLWLYRSVVDASPAGLTVRGGLLGIGRKRRYAAKDVRRFRAVEYMSSGSYVWKNIRVVPRAGKQRTIAKGIQSRLVERAVIDELNAALGLSA